MHSVVMHGYLWCCILLGYLHISSLSLSSGQRINRSTGLDEWLGYYGSLVRDHYQPQEPAFVETTTSSLPSNESISCEDLEGVGSFNTTCLLSSTFYLNSDVHIYGVGNLEILSYVSILCPVEGCIIFVNVSGNIKLGQNASIVAGSVILSAANLTMEYSSSINSSSLGGPPPSQTSGTPVGYDGAGGGHGGRGASCLKNHNKTNWGGDVYAWSTLSKPWSYGSKGGGKSAQKPYGGNGGGRVMLLVKDTLYVNGSVTAEGGNGGSDGGGGSGGSILIHAIKL